LAIGGYLAEGRGAGIRGFWPAEGFRQFPPVSARFPPDAGIAGLPFQPLEIVGKNSCRRLGAGVSGISGISAGRFSSRGVLGNFCIFCNFR
jgi:hypothetical protein